MGFGIGPQQPIENNICLVLLFNFFGLHPKEIYREGF